MLETLPLLRRQILHYNFKNHNIAILTDFIANLLFSSQIKSL